MENQNCYNPWISLWTEAELNEVQSTYTQKWTLKLKSTHQDTDGTAYPVLWLEQNTTASALIVVGIRKTVTWTMISEDQCLDCCTAKHFCYICLLYFQNLCSLNLVVVLIQVVTLASIGLGCLISSINHFGAEYCTSVSNNVNIKRCTEWGCLQPTRVSQSNPVRWTIVIILCSQTVSDVALCTLGPNAPPNLEK